MSDHKSSPEQLSQNSDEKTKQTVERNVPFGGNSMSRFMFWIDIETTGLDPKLDKILEISVVVTDYFLNVVDHYNAVIHQSKNETLPRMDQRWRTTHKELLTLVHSPETSKNLNIVAKELESLFSLYSSEGKLVLAGSSVHFDREVLRYHMPSLCQFIHYRIVDVSCFLLIFTAWYPGLYKLLPKKSVTHRSQDDIYSSLNLLKFFKDWIAYNQNYSTSVNLPLPFYLKNTAINPTPTTTAENDYLDTSGFTWPTGLFFR